MSAGPVELLAFTDKGYELAKNLAAGLNGRAARCGSPLSLSHWTQEAFSHAGALVYVGAAGIAVRAIAPYIQSKAKDPAVVVVDEGANWAVPVLSGHLGGANDLARRISALCGAAAVITTATDVNGVFAVDEWAKRQNCTILNPEKIKTVSAAVLAGQTVGVYSDFPIEGKAPAGVRLCDSKACDLRLSLRSRGRDVLQLVPRIAVLGVGCRKGISAAALEDALTRLLAKAGVCPQAITMAASIDLKKEEPGLLEFCAAHGWPLRTYSARQLAAVQGNFTSSAFVQKITGVDNVCERSAVLGAGGDLYSKKNAGNGVTMALALQPYAPDWRWQDE